MPLNMTDGQIPQVLPTHKFQRVTRKRVALGRVREGRTWLETLVGGPAEQNRMQPEASS